MNYRKFGLMLLTAALATMMACGIEDEQFGAEGTATAGPEPSVEATPEPTIASEPFERRGEGEYLSIRTLVPHLPRLNEPFTVTATFTAKKGVEDAELWINVEGGVYLDGEDRWHGPMASGDVRELSATFAVVNEGNHSAGARGWTVWGSDEQSAWVSFHSTATTVSLGADRGDDCCAPVFGGDDPPAVLSPDVWVTDTALALNESSEPRVEVVASEEDLLRLQAEGLLPTEMRHQWRPIEAYAAHNPHLAFFVAYYGPLRATPGCIVVRSYDDSIPWNDGNLQLSLTTHCISDEVPRADAPVSPVTVLKFARQDPLFGPEGEAMAYEGREFSVELIVDGESVGQISLDLRQ